MKYTKKAKEMLAALSKSPMSEIIRTSLTTRPERNAITALLERGLIIQSWTPSACDDESNWHAKYCLTEYLTDILAAKVASTSAVPTLAELKKKIDWAEHKIKLAQKSVDYYTEHPETITEHTYRPTRLESAVSDLAYWETEYRRLLSEAVVNA